MNRSDVPPEVDFLPKLFTALTAVVRIKAFACFVMLDFVIDEFKLEMKDFVADFAFVGFLKMEFAKEFADLTVKVGIWVGLFCAGWSKGILGIVAEQGWVGPNDFKPKIFEVNGVGSWAG